MEQEYVFRFLTVRSGNLRLKDERAPHRVPVYDPSRAATELGGRLRDVSASGGSAAEMLRAVIAFQTSPGYVKTLTGLPFNVTAGMNWVTVNSATLLSALDIAAGLQSVYGSSPAAIVATPAYLTTLDRISDTIVAESFRATWQDPTDPLAAARKLLTLLAWTAAGVVLTGTTLGAGLADLTLSISDFAALPRPPAPTPPPPTVPTPDPRDVERDRLRSHLADLEHTHRELSRTIVGDDALVTPRPVEPAPRTGPGETPRADPRPRPGGGEGGVRVPLGAVALSRPGIPSDGARVLLKPSAIVELSETSRRVMGTMKVDLQRMDPTRAVSLIEDEMRTTSAGLAGAQPVNTVLFLGGVSIESGRLRESLLGAHRDFGIALADRCNFQAGVGDLLMVKQKLKAYELAEFAHVENVLAGESREREHRRLNVREETVTTEEERETEKERNLQSTERNEMQAEAEKTVKSQFQLEAGLQISGSYGPSVSFSSSLNAGFSTSSEETQRKSVSYSREVTDKTSERVRERVRQEVRRRVLEQVEELNRHSITNLPATNGHIRGIYRWLNKVYDAQIFNYGQRMMFEFVVPEPAAFLLYAMIENPPQDNEVVKPEPPLVFGAPLNPSHLTRTGYLDWVAKYQVRNVPEPPPQFQHVTVFDKQDKVQDGSTFGRATKVEVPAGYEAYGATVMTDYTFTEDEGHAFSVMVGGTAFDRTPFWGAEYKALASRYKELGVTFHLWHAWSFAVAVDVYCRLTAEGFAKWQQRVYDAILEAYLQQKADYDEKKAAKAIQEGVKILGRNPLENRRIEREELKKLVLMMLTRSTAIARDSMQPGLEPVMDLQRACVNGSWIRFFENAFEWNNIMYVLYPYFWGRHARWISALHFTDPDLDFAAFLKAGAARVQVPVRPGFEKAVAHFCQFGEIWEGNDPPLRDDALYVPIVEEITENLGGLDEGVPFPEGSVPWEVRVPTSLVLVQNLDEIPGIRDILTGSVIAITS